MTPNCFGQFFHDESIPELLVRKIEKVQKLETSIIYRRDCSGCDMNPARQLYFVYKSKQFWTLKAYEWHTSANPARLVFSMKEKQGKGKISELLRFVKENFSRVQAESRIPNPFVSEKKIRINDTSFQIVFSGNNAIHGPFIQLSVKLAKTYCSQSVFGPLKLSELDTVLPFTGKIAKSLNSLYSTFSKENFSDNP